MIDEDERRRREAAIAYARASVELEGFQIAPYLLEQSQRFINGEIDLPEFVNPPKS